MNDRIPGTSYDNPLWYRKYRIYIDSDSPEHFNYTFVHDSYDGAEDAHDNRYGHAVSVDDAKAQIDEKEDD